MSGFWIRPGWVRFGIGKLMIYHWRGLAPAAALDTRLLAKKRRGTEPGIDDFIVFASFRRAQPNQFIYVIAIVLLGAMGSALLEVVKAVPGDGLLRHLATLGVLFALLLLLYAGTIQPVRNLLSKLRRWARSLMP